jgi:hypothetical protein
MTDNRPFGVRKSLKVSNELRKYSDVRRRWESQEYWWGFDPDTWADLKRQRMAAYLCPWANMDRPRQEPAPSCGGDVSD